MSLSEPPLGRGVTILENRGLCETVGSSLRRCGRVRQSGGARLLNGRGA